MTPHSQALIKMTKKQAVDEHRHLVKVLRTGKGLKAEANKQSKELKEYESKR
jgi:hypothetical protein